MSKERVQFVQNLVDGCMTFLPQLCDITLYSYQEELADRIFFSLLYGDAEEVTVETARQAGKSETLADVAATMMVLFPKLARLFPDDPVIKKFKYGVMIGCFGPTDYQAETIFSRIQSRLESEHAKDVLADPEINDAAHGSGHLISMDSGSFCRMQTAHPKAKIESKTYHVIIIDEAQDADSETVRRRIHPMMTAVGGSIFKVGTPTSHKSDYYEALLRNRRRGPTHGKKNYFAYDWRRAAKENPYYAQSIEREKRRLGEDSDEFQMCVAPDTMVLTADLKQIPAAQLQTRMALLGFDEHPDAYTKIQRYAMAIVEAVSLITRPCYELTVSTGVTLTCSAEHLWLTKRGWIQTKDLLGADRITSLPEVWTHSWGPSPIIGEDIALRSEEVKIVSCTPIGDRQVVAFRTSTRTFIAEGLASHNSYNLKWLLDRGMLISDEQIEELGDKSMQIVPYYTDSPIVIGVDVAAKHDSTVATAVWVDWEHPDEFGLFNHRILNWLELHGENWESQYRQICDFASRYSVMRMGVDAQGMGGPVAERLQVLLPNIEVVAMAMNPIDQSVRWQHLLQLIQRGMIGWPAHARTRRLRSYQRFVQQLAEVEKEYKGRYLMVGAPKNEKNAHDDYLDSLALACALTKEFGQNLDVEMWSTNPFLERGIGIR